MSFIPKFTNVDPRARLNFSWERSTRRLVEIARHQYKEANKEAELPPRGQTVEKALVALMLRDPAFKKLVGETDAKHPWFAEIEATLDEDEKEDKKSEKGAKPTAKPAAKDEGAKATTVTTAAPVTTPAPTPTPATPATRPAWPNN
jgi:hypothetical protein